MHCEILHARLKKKKKEKKKKEKMKKLPVVS